MRKESESEGSIGSVVAEFEAKNGYPKFMDYQPKATDKIGEAGAAFGGIALYCDGKDLYFLTIAMPFPEPVTVMGKLTGQRYNARSDMMPTGQFHMSAETAVAMLEAFAARIEARIAR